MVDMGQADQSLYRKGGSEKPRMCWTRALKLAASDMGYDHYLSVPIEADEELRQRAYKIIDGIK